MKKTIFVLFICVFVQGCAKKEAVHLENLQGLQRTLFEVGEKAQQQMVSHDITIEFPEDFIVVSGTLVRYQGKEEKVVVPEGISVIGESAFAENAVITSVQLPEGLKTIQRTAFEGCGNLREVTLPDTLETIGKGAFDRCFYLENIDLHMVKRIRQDAFFSCKNLKKVDLASVEELGEDAFCASGIREITGLDKITTVGNGVFSSTPVYENYLADGEGLFVRGALLIFGQKAEGTVEIPEGVKIVLDGAFSGNDRIVGVAFPDTVLEIGDRAFEGCSSLEEIYIPDSVVKLGDLAFSECGKLQQVRLPQRLGKVPTRCFVGCDIQEITIPQGCALGDNALYYCSKKECKFTLPPDIKSLGSSFSQHIDDENFDMGRYCFYTTDLSDDIFWVQVAKQQGWKLEALQLEAEELVLYVGEEYILRFNSGADAVWDVSDDAVLYLEEGEHFCERRLIAREEGMAVVTATIYGKEYTCRVKVVKE